MRKLILGMGTDVQEILNIKESGWDGVFFGYGKDETLYRAADVAKKEDLIIQSVHAPFDNVWKLWEGTDEQAQAEIDTQIACMKATAKIGVDLVVMHAIIGMNRNNPTELGVERFGKIVKASQEIGVRIALENTEGECYLAKLMEAYGDEKNVGFCVDTGHELCYNYGRDMIGLYGKKKVFGTHLNDNMGITGDKLTWYDDAHMLPFDGIADWQGIADRLKKAEFNGPLTFELIQNNRPERHTSDAYMKLSRLDYLRLANAHAVKFAGMMGD